ncbi:MAG: hypothetical protein CV045_11525 [Cyanobacteria bacterium M5B4]|nr:MAG: hypothetical protein CV045_11525 [Cyanobacteria bacterium M5B4]
MYLVSIHLQNFRQHKDTHIQFIQGITGILGQNGAGKSTILEAIAWAFYGNKPGVLRGTKDYLIWRGAPGKSEVIVDLEFACQNHNYRIQRSQTTSKITAQLWQDEVLVANSSTGVDEKIRQLLCMTHQEFFNSYFTGQKQLQFLGSIEGATARERFIAKMLGYEKIEEIQGKSDKSNTLRYDLKQKEKVKNQLDGYMQKFEGLSDRIAAQKLKIEDTRSRLQNIQRHLLELALIKDELEPQWQQINDRRTNFLQLQTKLQAHQSQLPSLVGEVKNLEQKQADLQQELDKFKQLEQEVLPYENLQKEYQGLEQNYQSFLRAQQIRDRLITLEQEITATTTELQNLEPIGLELSAIEQVIGEYRAQIADREEQIKLETARWQQTKAELEAKVSLEKQALAKAQKQHQTIIDAGEDGVCPTCERPLQEEYGNVVNGFLQQITECQQHISQWQLQIEQLAKKPATILELEQAQTLLLQELKQRENRQKELDKATIRRQMLEQQIKEKQKQLNKLQGELELQDQNQEFNIEYFQTVQEQIKQLRPRHEEFLKLAQTPHNFKQVTEQLLQKQQDVRGLNQKIVAIQQEIDACGYSEACFNQLQKQREEAVANYTAVNDQYRSIGQDLQYAEQELQKLEQEKQESLVKEEERKQVNRECLTLEELDKAFSALRQYLTEQIRPRLAQSASYFSIN